jgi:hypothetical protein
LDFIYIWKVPDTLLYKFQTAQLGCYRLAFSNNGNYLACACTASNSKTIIKIFSMEDGNYKFLLLLIKLKKLLKKEK